MLKALEISGFKSFADKTRFDFPSGITVIVGPNGSGKSNVVDAIKWVLGEQSAKSLRGKEMADVIFKGSQGRRMLNTAEATIVFDNSEGRLAIDAPEVHVTRRVYRSGEGEYLINRQPCRLKDIRDLFRGTGLGADAYSLIEQGKVDQLLQASPRDRRAIFEEAAGISRFKAKKLQAERRLERVEQNLLRLSDIVEEVENRLRTVRNQATKARRHREYSQRLQQLRTFVGWTDWRRMSEEIDGRQQQADSIREESRLLAQELERAERELAELERQTADELETFRREQQQETRSREQILSLEATWGHERDRIRDWEQEEADLRQRLRLLSSRQGDAQQQLETTTRLLEESAAQRDRCSASLERQARELSQVQAELDSIQGSAERIRGELMGAMRHAAGLGQRVSTARTRQESSRQTASRVGERLAEIEGVTAGSVEQLGAWRGEEQRLEEQIAERTASRGELAQRLDENRRLVARRKEDVAELNGLRSGLRERITVLEEMQRKLEGFSDGAREILGRAANDRSPPFDEVAGVVADFIEAPAEWAAMVDVALGASAQHVVLTGDGLIEMLRRGTLRLQGRVGLLLADGRLAVDTGVATDAPRIARGGVGHADHDRGGSDEGASGDGGTGNGGSDDRSSGLRETGEHATGEHATSERQPGLHEDSVSTSERDEHTSANIPGRGEAPWRHHPGMIGRADQLVSARRPALGVVRRLLAATWFVDDLTAALRLRRLGLAERMVTRHGELLETHGALVLGSQHAAGGLVSRRSELRSVREELANVESQIAETRLEISRLQENIDADDVAVARFDEELQRLGGELADCRVQRRTLQDRCERMLREQESLVAERTAAVTDLERWLADERDAESELAATEVSIRGLEESLGELDRRLAAQGRVRDELSRGATEARVDLARAEQHFETLRTARDRSLRDRGERAKAVHEARGQLQHCVDRQQGAARNQLRLGTALAQLYLDKERAATAASALASAQQRAIDERTSLGSLQQRAQRRRRKLEDELHGHELALNELRMQRTTLAERMRDDYGIDISAPDESEGVGEGREQIETEIADLRHKLNSIGPVNMEALEELDDLERRFQDLDGQYQDLKRAKEALERIIQRINADSRRLFVDTLEAIRVNFQMLYRRAFGGGHADLVLEEGEDVLDGGVDIVARPPGKPAFSNSLLSGGEKALTAVALLLAIFQFRPSPFCVLDEVDAPFDEANIGRFVNVLTEFLGWTKFVIVTHSKKTMTAANTLYGVTMQESGVSKRVSVRFEDVSEDGHISQEAVEREAAAGDDGAAA